MNKINETMLSSVQRKLGLSEPFKEIKIVAPGEPEIEKTIKAYSFKYKEQTLYIFLTESGYANNLESLLTALCKSKISVFDLLCEKDIEQDHWKFIREALMVKDYQLFTNEIEGEDRELLFLMRRDFDAIRREENSENSLFTNLYPLYMDMFIDYFKANKEKDREFYGLVD